MVNYRMISSPVELLTVYPSFTTMSPPTACPRLRRSLAQPAASQLLPVHYHSLPNSAANPTVHTIIHHCYPFTSFPQLSTQFISHLNIFKTYLNYKTNQLINPNPNPNCFPCVSFHLALLVHFAGYHDAAKAPLGKSPRETPWPGCHGRSGGQPRDASRGVP